MNKRIGLYDIDSKIPNLALMKLSAWHKAQGDEVALYAPILAGSFDKVYASKVFSFSDAPYLRPEMETGGTGIDLARELPPEVEELVPDYTLYGYPHSLGFSMRGCRFRCKFCVVPQKEGRPRGTKTIPEIWTNRGSRLVVLLDNDFFGNPAWRERIQEIKDLDLKVSFSQGLNIRLITEEQAAALASVHFTNMKGTSRQVYFAWDRPRDEKRIFAGIKRVMDAGIKPRWMAFYVLVGFDTTPAEDMRRVSMLAGLGCDPFVMPYSRKDPYQRAFARWCNHKAIFKTVPWEDYRAGVKRAHLPRAGEPEEELFPGLNI